MSKNVYPSWIYPKSIAVATDLTDLECLLPHAKAQAEMSGATLWLVHVIPAQVYVSPASGAYPFVPKEKAYLDAEAVLARETAQLRKERLSSEYEIRRFFEAEQIAAFVREKKIDRLIIGTSGKGKLGKLLLGSVAEELIRTIDIPVCTIGPHVLPPAKTSSHNILYATSLRHQAASSLRFALDVTSASSRDLTILHVVEHTKSGSPEELEARIKIGQVVSQTAINHVKPNIDLHVGDPVDVILSEAAVLRADLIILGAVPASNLTALVHTGVAYEVITQATCPVLTLRETLCAGCRLHEDLPTPGTATGIQQVKA